MFKRAKNSQCNWETDTTFSVQLKSLKNCKFEGVIYDNQKKSIIKLKQDTLIIYKGYQFDGCSGSPDFSRAIRGCCVHDALIQILQSHPKAFDIEDAHKAMLETHKASEFFLAKLYYFVVSSWIGDLYRLIKKKLV